MLTDCFEKTKGKQALPPLGFIVDAEAHRSPALAFD